MNAISNTDDLIDVRDVIERFEELENIEERDEEEQAEFETLESLLEDLKGNGGDEQWRGDWYPITLIRDDYFEDYAQELAEDIGAINEVSNWPNNCIDWGKAAQELQMDYTSIDFDGVDYWTH